MNGLPAWPDGTHSRCGIEAVAPLSMAFFSGAPLAPVRMPDARDLPPGYLSRRPRRSTTTPISACRKSGNDLAPVEVDRRSGNAPARSHRRTVARYLGEQRLGRPGCVLRRAVRQPVQRRADRACRGVAGLNQQRNLSDHHVEACWAAAAASEARSHDTVPAAPPSPAAATLNRASASTARTSA
jgi:hypothetical protein